MSKLFCILIFYCVSLSVNAATTTTSLNGEITACGASCQAISFLSGDLVQMDFSFDDSLFGTTISEADVTSWAITLTTQNIGTLPFTTSNRSIALAIGVAGNIIGGTASSNILVAGNLFNIAIDFGQLLPSSGSAVDWTNSSGSSLVFAGCFDGFSCNPVPLPAAAWLFGSGLVTLLGLVGLKRKK